MIRKSETFHMWKTNGYSKHLSQFGISNRGQCQVQQAGNAIGETNSEKQHFLDSAIGPQNSGKESTN